MNRTQPLVVQSLYNWLKKAWRHSFEGSATIANFGRFYPHYADGVLVWQVSRCVLSHEVSSLF